jgi:hypothetical protein
LKGQANMKNAPIRAVIADDEALARKFIRRMLKDDPDVEIAGECGKTICHSGV